VDPRRRAHGFGRQTPPTRSGRRPIARDILIRLSGMLGQPRRFIEAEGHRRRAVRNGGPSQPRQRRSKKREEGSRGRPWTKTDEQLKLRAATRPPRKRLNAANGQKARDDPDTRFAGQTSGGVAKTRAVGSASRCCDALERRRDGRRMSWVDSENGAQLTSHFAVCPGWGKSAAVGAAATCSTPEAVFAVSANAFGGAPTVPRASRSQWASSIPERRRPGTWGGEETTDGANAKPSQKTGARLSCRWQTGPSSRFDWKETRDHPTSARDLHDPGLRRGRWIEQGPATTRLVSPGWKRWPAADGALVLCTRTPNVADVRAEPGWLGEDAATHDVLAQATADCRGGSPRSFVEGGRSVGASGHTFVFGPRCIECARGGVSVRSLGFVDR